MYGFLECIIFRLICDKISRMCMKMTCLWLVAMPFLHENNELLLQLVRMRLRQLDKRLRMVSSGFDVTLVFGSVRSSISILKLIIGM